MPCRVELRCAALRCHAVPLLLGSLVLTSACHSLGVHSHHRHLILLCKHVRKGQSFAPPAGYSPAVRHHLQQLTEPRWQAGMGHQCCGPALILLICKCTGGAERKNRLTIRSSVACVRGLRMHKPKRKVGFFSLAAAFFAFVQAVCRRCFAFPAFLPLVSCSQGWASAR